MIGRPGIVNDVEALRDQFFAGLPRYRCLGILGRGGMGIVFRALDMELGETLAIKVLSTLFEDDSEKLLVRFKQELSLTRRIKHPNVARLYDFGMSGRYPYLTMELIPGIDLCRLVEKVNRFPALRAVSILRQIALGTAAAHREGIIHRDLKPSNVMVDDADGVAILDFGLARGKASTGITLFGTAIGTPQYMSPEQARGKPADARSDIYSIGVIGFEMISGIRPFEGDNPMEVATRHVEEPVNAAPMMNAEAPPRLVDVILRCLEKKPEARFPSASELEAALAVLGGLSEVRRTVEGLALPADLQLVMTALPPASPADEPNRRRPRVLVVDDEPMVRDLIGIYLEQAGIDSLMASTGEEALASLQTVKIDLVLLDVLMPVMDGFDTLRVVRAQPRFERVPIILMSSVLERNRLAFAIQSGASDFIPKPLDMPNLLAKVRGLLAERGYRTLTPQGGG